MTASLKDDSLRIRAGYTRVGVLVHPSEFHDSFIALGPLPLPLVRRAMLGESGALF